MNGAPNMPRSTSGARSSLFERASDIALRSLREPRTGLAALLGMTCDASKASLAAVYMVGPGSGVEFLAASGADPDGVQRLRDETPALEPALRAIVAQPETGFSVREGLPHPWGAHVVSATFACTLPEGTAIMLVAGDAGTNLDAIDRYVSAIALLSCAHATKNKMTNLTRQLQELRQERALLAAGLQHDLKTPITSMLGAAGILADQKDSLSAKEQSELLGMITRQGHRMKDMISTALAAESAEARPVIREAGLRDLARRVADVALMARPGEVVVEIGEGRIRTDPARLERILLNLIDNALRYAPEGTRVHVLGEVQTDFVAITVADLGPGVSDAVVPTLFSAYSTDPAHDGGTGLGLHNAARLAASLGGTLSYSRAAGWTRFTVTLPVASAP
jgi:signal transduction histidine kinase